MTAGLDAVIEFRAERETRDAFDKTVPEGVSRSEILREMMSDRIEANDGEVPDELLKDARRARANRRSDKDVDAATFRKRAKNLAKSLYGSGLTASEIAYAFRRRREEAEHLPEELNPEEAKEYVDCLLALVRLYDAADPNDAHGTDGLPNDLYPALDVVDSAYPEEHEDETRDIIQRAPTNGGVVREIDDAVSNGLVDGLIEDEDDGVPDDADIKMGGEAMTDGGVDVRETFEMDGETFEIASVHQHIRDQIEIDAWHGVAGVNRTSGAIHLTVCYSSTWGSVREDATVEKMPVLVYQNLTFDTDEETVALGDLIWLPQDADVAGAMGDMSRRARADMLSSSPVEEPLCVDADDEVDVEALMDRSVEVPDEDRATQDNDKMRSHPGISPERSWGYGGGPPPEIERVVDRLAGAGLDPEEHLFRLTFGKKEPFDTVDKSQSPPSRGHSVDELAGNYGIDCLSRDVGLVCVDVDYPEEFPDEELPDTFSVSSPHGDDSQRHLLFLCDEKEELRDEIGAWSTQAPEWGDLWAGANRYVVGPGCQLSEYGCNEGEHEAGERGACERCESEDGGYYEIVNDAPIMAVSAERLASLVPDDEETEEAGNPVSTGSDAPEGCVVADCCGAAYHKDGEGEAFMRAGNRIVCLGGCPHE
jgi:hypothetical protein